MHWDRRWIQRELGTLPPTVVGGRHALLCYFSRRALQDRGAGEMSKADQLQPRVNARRIESALPNPQAAAICLRVGGKRLTSVGKRRFAVARIQRRRRTFRRALIRPLRKDQEASLAWNRWHIASRTVRRANRCSNWTRAVRTHRDLTSSGRGLCRL